MHKIKSRLLAIFLSPIKLNYILKRLLYTAPILLFIFLYNIDLNIKKPLKFNFNTEPPSYVKSINGVSNYEVWGRWSDQNEGQNVSILFRNNLPNKFILKLELIFYGENLSYPLIVEVGNIKRIVTPNINSKIYSLDFYGVPYATREIKIIPFKPTQPSRIEMGSQDSRMIGVGLISLEIL